jgi:hypothetical protein
MKLFPDDILFNPVFLAEMDLLPRRRTPSENPTTPPAVTATVELKTHSPSQHQDFFDILTSGWITMH